MDRRAGRGPRRRRSVRQRIARFVGTLFSSGRSQGGEILFDPPVGGVGVREPRRPLHPTSSGAVALEPPPTEIHDVWAVGDEDRA